MKTITILFLLIPIFAFSQSNVKDTQTVNTTSSTTSLELITEPSGLELISDEGKDGWRLIGFNPDLYGNTGNNAVSLSINTYANNTLGAMGDYSFSCGKGTAATGSYSFASGDGNYASGDYSFASGSITNASGTNSTATGKETIASGVCSFASGEATTASNYYSTAMGYTTIASGSTSFATGNETLASGDGSFTQGEQTIAQNTNQLSTGKYNLGTSTTTIHETGIGTGVNRKNAFEVHTDGKVWADHLEVAGHISITNTGNSVFIGEFAGLNDDLSDNRNVFVGRYSGTLNTTGNYNNAFGHYALTNNTTGQSNVAIGSNAMEDNQTGTANTAIGNSALYQVTSGNYNVAVGNQALGGGGGTSNANVAVGYKALRSNQFSNNTAIGYQAGSENLYGTGNVFIGYQAAQNLSAYGPTASNKLYIENSNSSTPLIYGDFAADSLVINGDMTITGKVTFTNNNVPYKQNSPGTQGQIIYGEDYIYICIQPDEWKRVPISTW